MADDAEIAATSDSDRRDAFVGALFGATIGALDLLHIYVGDRLGLYQAMAGGVHQTPIELARAAGINERYAREWLEHQAVAKVVDVVNRPGFHGDSGY